MDDYTRYTLGGSMVGAGVLILIGQLRSLLVSGVTCDGEEMRPGDYCSISTRGMTETLGYEEMQQRAGVDVTDVVLLILTFMVIAWGAIFIWRTKRQA